MKEVRVSRGEVSPSNGALLARIPLPWRIGRKVGCRGFCLRCLGGIPFYSNFFFTVELIRGLLGDGWPGCNGGEAV